MVEGRTKSGRSYHGLLAIALLVLLPGCGDDETGAENGTPADGESTMTSTTTDGSGGSASTSPDDSPLDTTDGETTQGDTSGDDPIDEEPTPEVFTFCDDAPSGDVLEADSDDYRSRLDEMRPGDTLRLAPGTYTQGLPIHFKNGSPGACYVIEGPAEGERAVFLGSSTRNTVSLRDSSYVVVRNLELDGNGEIGDAVKAEGHAEYAHHIVLEGLFIHDHDAGQGVVGISNKCPAWHWVIRENWIESTGTGLYLGNSNGADPFVGGLIEGNVVLDTLGYNMQIKHQIGRPDLEGLPEQATTIIRHNVFSKQQHANGGGQARPNLLLGHFPTEGPGVDDQYLVYGNFFHDNPVEALVQAEGNVALYNNVLVNPSGPAIHIQPHNDVPRRIHVLFNTVVASGRGIRVTGGDPGHLQLVAGNAVFADPTISADMQEGNIVGSLDEAEMALVAPSAEAGAGLDVHPLEGSLQTSIDTSGFDTLLWWDRDFDRRPRDGDVAGAYAGTDDGTGWSLDRAHKP
jgi:hypothetical protein